MLRRSIFVLLSVTALAVPAETPHSIVNSIEKGNISIVQPEALARLLAPSKSEIENVENETSTKHATSTTTRTGYRIQVFEDNNPRTARNEAESRNAQIRTAYPNLRTNVTFNSPYWRVIAGDFRTRAEAEAVLAELKNSFPALGAYMRIVRDRINIGE